jgi:hypothetical protein
MALIYSGPSGQPDPAPGTPEFAAMMEPWEKANEAFIKAGVMGGGEALMPVETATTLRIRNGKTETMDGPFAETKEQLGGYYIFECKDLDEALHYAAMIPVAEFGSVEVRPVMELG